MDELKVFDMFAGIGGFRVAIENSPIPTRFVGYCENDRFATATYEHNFDVDDEVKIGDVCSVLGAINEGHLRLPRIDLLTAGFPCQAFSSAGLEQGFNDPRGSLFFDLIEFIELTRPRAVLLENVKQITSTQNGAVLNTVLEELARLGYHCQWSVLDSSRFGLPQKRERWVCVGFLDESLANNFSFPEGNEPDRIIRDIVINDPDEIHFLSERALEPLSDIEEVALRPGICIQKIIPYKRQKSVYSLDGLAPTAREGHGDFIRIKQDDGRIRRLTPREGLRLMGFPEDFELLGSITRQFKLIGNSIAVPQMESVFNQIARVLL